MIGLRNSDKRGEGFPRRQSIETTDVNKKIDVGVVKQMREQHGPSPSALP